MSTDLIPQTKVYVPVIDDEIFRALKHSVYPGALDESIKMVLEYCRAAKLDPLQKVVHIVPMNVRDAKTGKYEWRDVIMPGIGLYRTQASRTEQCMGISEPEFGPTVEKKFDIKTVSYPEWCKIIVKRLINGQIVEFIAKEFWIENYATAKESTDPNKMWAKRPYAQLAKCTEAQALRKAFPELGAQPTAEEMEGKVIEYDSTDLKETNNRISALQQLITETLSNKKEPINPLAFKDLETVFNNAKSIEELEEYGKRAKSFAGTPEELEKLRDIYDIRRTELSGEQCASE